MSEAASTDYNLGDLHPDQYIRVARSLGEAVTIVDVVRGSYRRTVTLRYVVTCFYFWPQKGIHLLAGYRVKKSTGATFGNETAILGNKVTTVGSRKSQGV